MKVIARRSLNVLQMNIDFQKKICSRNEYTNGCTNLGHREPQLCMSYLQQYHNHLLLFVFLSLIMCHFGRDLSHVCIIITTNTPENLISVRDLKVTNKFHLLVTGMDWTQIL